MFTESVRVGCSFLACHAGSAKYKTCMQGRRKQFLVGGGEELDFTDSTPVSTDRPSFML